VNTTILSVFLLLQHVLTAFQAKNYVKNT